jgi:hypothetical protein
MEAAFVVCSPIAGAEGKCLPELSALLINIGIVLRLLPLNPFDMLRV